MLLTLISFTPARHKPSFLGSHNYFGKENKNATDHLIAFSRFRQ